MNKEKKTIKDIDVKKKDDKQQKIEDAELSAILEGIRSMLNSDKK